jgi:hypothetical protein
VSEGGGGESTVKRYGCVPIRKIEDCVAQNCNIDIDYLKHEILFTELKLSYLTSFLKYALEGVRNNLKIRELHQISSVRSRGTDAYDLRHFQTHYI